MDSKQIGSFIATLRKEQGMTQRELANKLNITDKAVSKWENGDGYPEITIVPALAEILGVTTDELFRGERAGKQIEQTEPVRSSQSQYFIEAALMKFKNLSLLATGLAVLGLVAFFTITHSTYYETIGFGIQVTFLLASVILFKIAYDSYLNTANKYRELSDENQIPGVVYANKTLMTSIWLWVCTITSTLPYLIFDGPYTKSIITFSTYLRFLPIFLIFGVTASWFLCYIARDRLKLSHDRAPERRLDKICIAGLVSDIFLGLVFVGAVLSSFDTLLPIGFLLYLAIPAFYAFWQRGKLAKVMTAAFFVRNIGVGLAIGFGVGNNIYFYNSYVTNSGGVGINWPGINLSLFVLILPAIILATLALQYLVSRKNKESVSV